MANFEIPENPEYTEEVRKFEEEDPGHADLFNAVIEKLLNNEAFLKRLAEKQQEEAITKSNIGSQNVNYANSTDRAVADKHGNDIADTYIKRTDLLNSIYPIGAIYMSTSSANPGTLFGGTWVEWGNGRVPVGINTSDGDFNSVEKTGGEKSHSLSSTEMPSHSHIFTGISHAHTLNGHSHSIPSLGVTVDTNGSHAHSPTHGTSYGFQGYLKSSTFGRERVAAGSGKYSFVASTNTDLTYEETTNSTGSHSHTAYTAAGNTGTNYESTSVITAGGTNSNTGGSGAHNNLQPYITCYMWKRTA